MVKRIPEVDPPNIELRLPAPWKGPAGFMDAMEKSDYTFEDSDMVHRETGWKCEVGASPHDDEIVELFAHEGRLSYKELKLIDSHAAKVHLIAPGGSADAARKIVDAASAVVRSGAFGVMVDNSGITHGTKDWLKLADDPDDGGLYWAFVMSTRTGQDTLFSCGMHCLGLRDGEIRGAPSEQAAWMVLHNFLGFTYRSGKTVIDGEPVDDPELSMFRARAAPFERAKPGTPFHNPYGVWRLELMDEDEDDQ